MAPSTICVYFMLFACGLAIGLAAIRYDLYKREPWYMVLLGTALGAAAMWTAYYVEVWIIRQTHTGVDEVGRVALAVIAGTTEELAKFGIVVLLAFSARRQFTEPLDGLVYGSFAGLGAAIEESVSVLHDAAAMQYLPPQEPVRLVGHLVMGGIGGFGVGLLLMRRWRAVPAVLTSLGAAIALHTAWDVAAFSDHSTAEPRVFTWHAGAAIGIMLAGMLIYRKLVSVGARQTRAYLQVCDVQTRECPPAPSLSDRTTGPRKAA